MIMAYVLFREDPNTHKEVYLLNLVAGVLPQSTKEVRRAKHFNTAAAGYTFGALFGLNSWRVGQR